MSNVWPFYAVGFADNGINIAKKSLTDNFSGRKSDETAINGEKQPINKRTAPALSLRCPSDPLRPGWRRVSRGRSLKIRSPLPAARKRLSGRCGEWNTLPRGAGRTRCGRSMDACTNCAGKSWRRNFRLCVMRGSARFPCSGLFLPGTFGFSAGNR